MSEPELPRDKPQPARGEPRPPPAEPSRARRESQPAPGEPQRGPGEASDPRRGALIGLLVIVLLILGGIFLTYVLRRESRMEDCLMSGRTNCAPIDTTSGR